MKITGKVTNDEAKTIERMVRQCMNLLRKKEYELDIPAGAADAAIRCLEVKRRKDSASRANGSFIRINLGYWQVGNRFHTEYAAFNDHPIIGKVECASELDHYLCTVAHEVAHFVQYRYCRRVQRFKGTYKKPHGKCFQDIYLYLRRDLVNPRLKESLDRANTLSYV